MSKHTLRPYSSIAALVLSLAASIDCTSDRTAFQNGDLDAGAAEPAPFVTPDAEASDAGAVATDQECSGDTKLVYVFTRDAKIVRFDPSTLTFTKLGALSCPDSLGAFSMAIDRRGTAWIEYGDERVFHVPLNTLECTEIVLKWPAGAAIPNWGFGMAFSKDDSETGESLFLGGEGLWKTNPRTLEVERVGEATPLPNLFELTGTGDGKLYGWASTNGILGRLDPVTGDTLEWAQTTDLTGGAWAFAQWGGDFWCFVQQYGPYKNTSVVRYNPVTRTSAVVVEDAGFIIVGAGSSTCAPYEPPK